MRIRTSTYLGLRGWVAGVFSISWSAIGLAAEYTGQVVGLIDGDTLRILYEGKTEAMRLDGVDCPGQNRVLGRRAKAFTSSETLDKEVRVKMTRRDHSGRLFVEIMFARRKKSEPGTAQGGMVFSTLAR